MKNSSCTFAAFIFAALFSCSGASVAQTAVVTAPAAPAAVPAPDVIVFTNGDQLSGKLIRGVGGNVVFKSDMAGEIVVSLDKVKELRSSASFALLRKGLPVTRTPARTGTILYGDGSMTVANASGAPDVVPAKEVAYLIDQTTYERELKQHPSLLHGWNGAINGGATLVRSTTDANTYNLGISLVRLIPTVPYLPARDRTTFNMQETYGKLTTPVTPAVNGITATEAKTSIFHADAERDEYFSPRFYALVQTSFDHNSTQGLSLQQVYGGGAGWTPIKTPKQQLDVKADIHYERQSFLAAPVNPLVFPPAPLAIAPPSLSLVGSTISDAYRLLLPYKLIFTQTANILPAFNNASAYSANVTAGLALPVYKRLAVQFSTTDNYLNDPAPTFKKNSYQFVTGVTYTLH